jgi:rhodanese-related sulfurtransferase
MKTPEDIYSFDGTAIPVVTRVRRSGTPGNYYITISFDDVSAVTFGNKVGGGLSQWPEARSRLTDPRRRPKRVPRSPHHRRHPKGRILVVDEDRHRSAAQVAALKREGFDAVATASVGETLAFLEAAREMKLAISEIKISARLSQMISIDAARNHPVLEQALRAELPVSTSARSAPEKAADAPVPSLVTASGSSEEEVVASARTAVLPHSKPVSQDRHRHRSANVSGCLLQKTTMSIRSSSNRYWKASTQITELSAMAKKRWPHGGLPLPI